ncbi:sulfite exporter TauE/SafE family protein [Croceimicrobium hydrocarbonivorans]|uniref:Sulfite exporter TauE/SafE family protein n=1 Tax=Croceimicrobium hydrocarbonivorans TaxID=2761580 RepID=A0A7H0VIL0_9FLAO|nr:sulfite exporter TauE/SafE family protein [Croceimicrobium hydrocarbonivorans]QNR25558.1 sulfite exporter TauE/SafE family protein [Croceimicrobium hydrocarbonivorans]
MYGVAFTFGLLSSLHCLAMCGPLQAVVMGQWLQSKHQANWISYHAGRLGTYMLLAIIASLLGSGLGIPDMQGSFTILAGLILLLGYFGFKALKWDRKTLQLIGPILSKLQSKVRGKKHPLWYLISGSLNGLLPCGMVYAALVPALGLSSWTEAILYMGAFGLGTLPLLLSFNLFSNALLLRFGPYLNRLIPLSIVLISALLILRGMELDIPYLSPEMPVPGASTESCG